MNPRSIRLPGAAAAALCFLVVVSHPDHVEPQIHKLASGDGAPAPHSVVPTATADLVAQARQALDANKVDDAIAILENAVAAEPMNAAALAWLGSARVRKARTASFFEAPGWVKKGFNTLDEAVDRFPDVFIVYVVRGISATQVPEFFRKAPVAVKDLSKVVGMKEKSPEAVPDAVMPTVYLHLGVAYKKSGQPAEARAAWETGKKLYPSAPEAQAIDKELRNL